MVLFSYHLGVAVYDFIVCENAPEESGTGQSAAC